MLKLLHTIYTTVLRVLDIRRRPWWLASIMFYGVLIYALMQMLVFWRIKNDLTLAQARIETVRRYDLELVAATQTLRVAYGMSQPVAEFYAQAFRKHARRYGYPWEALGATTYIESRYNQSAKSPVGACGLMQLMEPTAEIQCRKLGLIYERNNTVWNPTLNIYLGASYFNDCYSNDKHDPEARLFEAFSRYLGGVKYKKGLQSDEYSNDVLREYKKLTYIYQGILIQWMKRDAG